MDTTKIDEMNEDELRDVAKTLCEQVENLTNDLKTEKQRNSDERKKLFSDFFNGAKKGESEDGEDGEEDEEGNSKFLKILANRFRNK